MQPHDETRPETAARSDAPASTSSSAPASTPSSAAASTPGGTPSGAAASTPALDRALARTRQRLSKLVWMHGLGTVAIAAAATLSFAFLADWTLHVPRPVRFVHLALLFAVPAYFVVRDLLRPLRRRPDRAGAAVLIERAHPELKELLVSAVQFASTPQPPFARSSVDSVLREAEARSRELELGRVLDPRSPRARALWGIAGATACALLLALNADAALVFFARMAGADVAWPQRTHLAIDIPVVAPGQPKDEHAPSEGAAPHADESTHEIAVRVARGSDVPVLVRARGVVPEEVTLHFDGGHKAVLASAGGNTFRTLLRSCQENLEFYATGGDDLDEEPRVKLIVLQPPDVAGIAVRVEPPAYTGLEPRTEFDRDVEVVAGSNVTVHVRIDPSDASGVVRLLPEDRVVELHPAPFPLSPAQSDGAPRTAASDGSSEGRAFDIVPQKSLRYRFELTDSAGLTNPDPGLFGIAVIEDRAPEVEVLSPGRGDFDTVVNGLIALRVRAQDDFGIESMTWSAAATGHEDAAPAPAHPLEWTPIADDDEREPEARAARATDPEIDERRTPRAGARVRVLSRQRFEVSALSGAEPPAEGQQFELAVTAIDNASPQSHEGRSAAVRVRVVSRDEFLRRVQDRLARAQASASALGDLQRDKLRRALDLLAGIESDALLQEGTSSEVSAALTGERRVLGDARALARELAALVEAVLYARIDDRAGAALEFIDARLSQSTGRTFDPAPWRELANASRQGELGSSGLSSRLIDILGVALEIGEEHVAGATDALARAQDLLDFPKLHAELSTATDSEKKALVKIESLLAMLAEWDNFQSVLNLARDILHGQKTLSERTRQFAKDH